MRKSINKKYLLSIIVLLVSFFIVSGSVSAADVEMSVGESKSIYDVAGPGADCVVSSGGNTLYINNYSFVANKSGTATANCTMPDQSIKKISFNVKENENMYDTYYDNGEIKQGTGHVFKTKFSNATSCFITKGQNYVEKLTCPTKIGMNLLEIHVKKDAPVNETIMVEVKKNSTLFGDKKHIFTINVIGDGSGSSGSGGTNGSGGSNGSSGSENSGSSGNSGSVSSNKYMGEISLKINEQKNISLGEVNGGPATTSYLASSSAKSGNSTIANIRCERTYCLIKAKSSGSTMISFDQVYGNSKITYSYMVIVSGSNSENKGNPVDVPSNGNPNEKPKTPPSSVSGAINNINWAEALETGDCRYYQVNLTHNQYKTYSYTYQGATHTGPVNLYSATEMCNNKNEYYSFCYDPDKAYHSAYNPYEFDNYINPFDGINVFPSAAGDSSIKQEAFIYYIYKKYGEQLDNTDIRAGIVIAIRAYQQMMDGSSSSNGKSAAFWQLANSWECEAGSSMCKPASTVVTNLNFGDIEGTAKSIYLDAKAVADTCTSSGCSGLEEIGVKWSQMESVECATEGGTLIKKVQGSIAGLENYNGEYTYLEPICPAGLTCELRINNGVVSPGSRIPSGTKYEIWIKGSSDAFAKASGEVGVRVRALSKDDYHNVILLKSVNNSGSSQRFVTFLKNDQQQELSIVVADISDVTCGKCGPGGDPMLDPTSPAFNKEMYIAKCCDEPDALPEYCPTKDDVCVQAKWNLVCGGDGEIYEIHEGISQKTGKMNYKDCIIDEKDPAENTYNIIKNRYCTISCKEDWEFQMPGDLGEHKAGTYMILAGSVGEHSLRVKGSRTCVAGNGSTKTAENEITTNYAGGEGYFQRDLEKIDNDIVKALNEYSEAAAYVYWFDKQSTKTSETKNYSCGGGDAAKCGSVVSRVERSVTLGDKRTLNGTVKYRIVKFTPEKSYDANGKLGNSEKHIEFDEGYTKPKCKNGTTCGYIELVNDGDDCKSDCHGNVVEAKQDYGYDAWVSKRDNARNRYNQLIAQRQDMIEDITECNTWENNFKYEPEISYTYQEHDYMNQLQGNNKFQIIGGGTPATSDKERTYRDQESKRDDYTQMNGNGQGSAYKQEKTNNIFTCSLNDDANGKFISDCQDKDQNMYYSSSILLEKQAEYSYEIRGRWYTVHDSGAAIYNSSEELKTQLDDKTSLVTGDAKGGDGKVLPISENTQPGDYNYQLRFVDVGQYNGTPDNQALGRLIGGNDKSHSGKGSVFAALKGYKNVNTNGLLSGEFDQTYMCTYHIVNKNPCASKIKTEIISLIDCPDGYRCSGYENDSGYIDVTGDVSFFVNNVSLNNINPNNRNMGSNWTNEIGQQVKAEIEELGDGAYAKDPEYSFTVSPKGMVALKSQASNINYGGFELACESDAVCTNPWLDTLKDIDGVTVNSLRG